MFFFATNNNLLIPNGEIGPPDGIGWKSNTVGSVVLGWLPCEEGIVPFQLDQGRKSEVSFVQFQKFKWCQSNFNIDSILTDK